MSKVYLEVSLGSPTAYSHLLEQHEKLCSWLKSNAASYGLPEDLKELDEVGRETVLSCFSGENPGIDCLFDPPNSLSLGKIEFQLSSLPNLSKQTENFQTLCLGTKSATRNKKGLWYKDTPLHRYVNGFVVQGGDVTRGDGSGGESIYGGTIPDPKPPHLPHSYGSLSFASGSSKNSSTSQFFICLLPTSSSDPSISKAAKEQAKKKLDGKYYPFGEMVAGREVLEELERRLGAGGLQGLGKGEKCWVSDCGVC